MEELIDPEILMMVGIFIMSFVLLNLLFKFVSMPNLVKRLIIITFIVGMIFMVYSYIDKHEVETIESTKTVAKVVGRVDIVSTTLNKIQITYKNSNLPKSNISKNFSNVINVKITDRLKVYKVTNGVSTEINVKSLSVGDIITVNCKETKLEGETPEITPVTIFVSE